MALQDTPHRETYGIKEGFIMEAVVTKDIALRILLHGACSGSIPKVGNLISQFSTSELIWVEDRKVFTDEEIKKTTGVSLPLWICSGYGYAYGDGYGENFTAKILELI